MNPWDLISAVVGWLIIVLVTLIIGAALSAWLATWRKHRQTRNVRPERGQVWVQGTTEMTVLNVGDGRVSLTTHQYIKGRQISRTGITWSDSEAEWLARVHTRRLWLKGVTKV